MQPRYYVVEHESDREVPAAIRPAMREDYVRTEAEGWQTSWLSDYIRQDETEKYALEITGTKELVGLGAYQAVPEGLLVLVSYIESEPGSNPTITKSRHYDGIGAALLAYGVQLSIDHGFGGAIYLKAKTTALREHYIRDFGATPFSRIDPYMLLIEGDASWRLLSQYGFVN